MNTEATIRPRRATRRLAARTVIPIACVAAMAIAAPASAAKLGGQTTLAPDPETIDALAAEGVSVAPAGEARATGKGIAFPITGGKANLNKGTAKINHSGGLTLTQGETSATVENYLLKVGKRSFIKAEVAGADGRIKLADLDLDRAKIKATKSKVTISGVDVLLADQAAETLAGAFGLPNLAGADLGDATVKLKP